MIFDGFDEITYEDKKAFVDEVKWLLLENDNIDVIISSRNDVENLEYADKYKIFGLDKNNLSEIIRNKIGPYNYLIIENLLNIPFVAKLIYENESKIIDLGLANGRMFPVLIGIYRKFDTRRIGEVQPGFADYKKTRVCFRIYCFPNE